MTDYLPHACDQMVMAVNEESLPIRYNCKLREYSIPLSDQEAIQRIHFCPFCGAELPSSMRDEWFDRLDALGLEPELPSVPASMRDDEWWLQAN